MALVSSEGDGWSSSAQQDKARAERLLVEALERDPNRSMAHYALGRLRRMQKRLPESQIELETAVALDRNNALARLQLANTLLFMASQRRRSHNSRNQSGSARTIRVSTALITPWVFVMFFWAASMRQSTC
jgi:tetratricopeptide (TPR) repeat protein